MWKQFVVAMVVGMVLPGLLFAALEPNKGNPSFTVKEERPNRAPQIVIGHQPNREDEPVYIPVMQADGTVKQMELEEYVWGVVLGEMPASFELEALKAQAVAARTYTLRCIADKVHDGAAVCTDHRCCQNYCDPADYGGGKQYAEKVRSAVTQTAGQVAVYNDLPIFAAYFASSGGSTEDAVAVWGSDVPYLKSVDSPGEGDKSYQNTVVTLTASQFQQKLGRQLDGKTQTWFGKVTYTAGGGVDTMMIGGKSYSGVKLRSLLGLRSTMFSVRVESGKIVITSNGYGHRVGMSQYGAQAMAQNGSDYREIICYYYQGVTLKKYPPSGD